jgi:hypothetical protein
MQKIDIKYQDPIGNHCDAVEVLSLNNNVINEK